MKFIALIIVLFFSARSFAKDFSNNKMLQVLLENSGQVNVYTKDETGEHFYKKLSEIIATHLLNNNHLDGEAGQAVVLTNTSLTCDDGEGAVGTIYFSCRISFGDGDFLKTEKGYAGPELESSLVLTFTIRYIKMMKEYRVHNNKATATLAG